MNLNLPRYLDEYFKLLKSDEKFQELLRSIPIPDANREWAPGFEETTFAYQTGMARGVRMILALLGRGPNEQQQTFNKE